MKKFGIGNGVVWTDQGGKLARSDAYRALMLDTFGYVVEPTGADSPSQNGGAEIYVGPQIGMNPESLWGLPNLEY